MKILAKLVWSGFRIGSCQRLFLQDYQMPTDASKARHVPPTRQMVFARLFRRFFILLALTGLLPLAVIAGGAYIALQDVVYEKSVEHLESMVAAHAATIEVFLSERAHGLSILAATLNIDALSEPERLDELLLTLNGAYQNSFTDLGVINSQGEHIAYSGPYDLLAINYSKEAWFEQVRGRGHYISNVFLGFRQKPHFIVAVRHDNGEGFWILRASINSEVFNELVTAGIGKTGGSAFLVDDNGRYQTAPGKEVRLLDPSPVHPERFEGVRTARGKTVNGDAVLRTMKWIREPAWLLIVQQRDRDFMSTVREATMRGSAVLFLAVAVIVVAVFFITRFLVSLIRRAVDQKDVLNQQFMQASKLASIGEMSTGLAHEINNPLAIIFAEQTNITDVLNELGADAPIVDEIRESVAITRKQVNRCKAITQRMLQFGRSGEGQPKRVQLGQHLAEICELMDQQARVSNIAIHLETEAGLPPVIIDPSEFEQVITNLVQNAIQAIDHDGSVLVSAERDPNGVYIQVEDTGPGIKPEHLDNIFTPFFTTKPVGKGTGLGLSVCYGIVTKWRGRIWAASGDKGGASFHLLFPAAPAETGSDRKGV
jgi:two-component system NtrC family sensor kinase